VCDGRTGRNGGLVVFVNGVFMGMDTVTLPSLPIGEQEVVIQVGRGPQCFDYQVPGRGRSVGGMPVACRWHAGASRVAGIVYCVQ
jgi:hypothetical protein